MTGSILTWTIAAILLFWTVGAYNRLMRLRAEAIAAFAAVDGELARQVELVRDQLPSPEPTQPAPLELEPTSFWASLHAAATQLAATLTTARSKPLDPDRIAALSAAQAVLATAWECAERDDAHDLAGPRLPDTVLLRRSQWLLQAHAATDAFNIAVSRYNDAIAQFPALLLAWLFGFRPARPLPPVIGPQLAWETRLLKMTQPTPLWRLLQAAARIVGDVLAGTSAAQAVPRVDAVLRPGAQALAFHALRQLGRAQALRSQLARRAPPPPADALLCTALALAWRDDEAPYPVFTLVDQAVEAAKRDVVMRAQANFINACLRRFMRERDALVAATDADAMARWNHPKWWITRLRVDHPQHWEQILEASNRRAPMTLRVNARRSTPAQYIAQLESHGLTGTAIGEHGVLLGEPCDVHQVPGFDAGIVSVQDAGAQLAAPLLVEGLQHGAGKIHILDACAAPGGKTAHILELTNSNVLALDISPSRCERIASTLARVGVEAEVLSADAAHPEDWWDGHAFDAILLDAPCTASGIVRRHPDVRWLRRPTDIEQLAAIQAQLLAVLWPLLRPGGRMVYCTCSVFRAEGELQVQTFLAHNKDAVLRPGPGHLLPCSGSSTMPVRDNPIRDHDGFFYAVLDKAPPRSA